MAGGQDIPALGIKTPQIAGGKRGDKENEAEEITPRPTPKMHTIKKNEMLQTIGYHYGADTDLAYGDAGGTILSRINAKVLRRKDGSPMPPNVFLNNYVGVNIWLEEPLDYTKRLNEWYKNNPSEKPIRLPLIQKSAAKGGKNKKAEDNNADFLAWKKMYNLPEETTYEDAWVYWREELMWQWADNNPDLVVYDLDNTETFDFDATYWEWYKTTPMYAQEQAKIGQHLLNFGYFMSEILGASGIPNMKAPPVRPKNYFKAKNLKRHKKLKKEYSQEEKQKLSREEKQKNRQKDAEQKTKQEQAPLKAYEEQLRPKEGQNTVTLYRGTTGSEKNGGALFLTDDLPAAQTYCKNGGTLHVYEIDAYALYELKSLNTITNYIGKHGRYGETVLEYVVRDGILKKAFNNIGKPF